MKKANTIHWMAMLAVAAAPNLASDSELLDLLARHDYATARTRALDCANSSHRADCEAIAGMLLFNGEGGSEDRAAGFRLVRSAADKHYAIAEGAIGTFYFHGVMVNRNVARAFQWWHRAATHCDAGSQFVLAVTYRDGDGVQQNLPEALYWARIAAHYGYRKAVDPAKTIAADLSAASVAAVDRRVDRFIHGGKVNCGSPGRPVFADEFGSS
jgi:TPR repeat protein